MIKISSFYPFAGFRRVTYEFQEDKVLVKTKSLTHERDFEFEYKDVGEISDVFMINSSQNTFGFWLLVSTALVVSLYVTLLCDCAPATPILLRIGQILYVCGLILYIASFKKSWYTLFLDKNDNQLTYIKQTRQNRDLVDQIIEMVRNKSENLQKLTAADPFPTEASSFEHIYYDLSDLKKTIDRFYDSRIIGYEKSIFSESVYSTLYSQLNGKLYRGKSGSDISGDILTLVTLLISIIGGFLFGFGPSLGISISMNVVYILLALGILFLISLPVKLIKHEVVGFYDKNGNVAYWTYVNRTSKEKVEKIIKFVQSRISSITNDDLLKEQA